MGLKTFTECIPVNNLVQNGAENQAILQAALGYARHGLPVVQVKPKDKKPIGNDWQRRATSDPLTVQVQWQLALDANVGVQMGRGQQPIIDIECDSDEAEEEYKTIWNGNPPVVPSYRGRRGRHYLFRWRPGLPDKAAFHAGAVEVRTGNGGKGAQSVFPPSIHPSGTVYAWEPGLSLDDVPLGDLPDEIVAKLVAKLLTTQEVPDDKDDSKSDSNLEHAEAIKSCPTPHVDRLKAYRQHLTASSGAVQGRNADGYCYALAVAGCWDYALSVENVENELYEWGQKDGQRHDDGAPYPWTWAQIRHKVQDAACKGSPKTYVGNAVWDRDAQKVQEIVTGGDLPTPSRNGQSSVDVPDSIRDIVEAQSAKPARPSFCNLVTSAELLAMDMRPEFLVRGVLVKGAPCIIGGRSKAMKTSIAVDLALSLGSGKPFLGRYDVPKPVRVAFWTGESGAPTIRETALRIAKSKGIDLKDVSVSWSFDLPKLCRIDHLSALEQVIREQQLEVIVIDPLYLSLLSAETAGSAGNIFAMGAALEPLSRLAQATGCTIILLHHFRKSGIPDPENPAALEELSQSGAAEWARQWILLQRRTPYVSDGRHDLWLRAGGSAGHSVLVAVTVVEGLIDPDTGGGGTGRSWSPTGRRRSPTTR